MALSALQTRQRSASARAASRSGAAPARRLVTVRAAPAATQAVRLPKWEDMWGYLARERGLRSIPPEQAAEMVASGDYVLVDVRLPAQYATAHPAGAVSVPMYQTIDMSEVDARKVIKTLFYRFNGVNPVEPNPKFMEQMKAITSSGKGVITLCEAGGTLVPSTNFPTGKASRSLQATWRLLFEGVTDKVAHVDRGAYGWYQAGLEFEGTAEYQPDIGKTPSAAAEPTLKNLQDSVGYDVRPGDKPDEKKNKMWPF